jgi:hypothetical protein
MSGLLVPVRALDAEARRALYAGAVLVIRQLGPLKKLSAHAELTVARDYHSAPEQDHTLEQCSAFEADGTVRQLVDEMIAEAGGHPQRTFSDRVRLRIQRPLAEADDVSSPLFSCGRFSSTLPLHRDTWASNIPQQVPTLVVGLAPHTWLTPLLALHLLFADQLVGAPAPDRRAAHSAALPFLL